MKKVIYVILFIILLSVVLYFSYKNFSHSSENYYNVSVVTYDGSKRVKTTIQTPDFSVNTSKSYEIFTVPEGILYISNKNIEDQNYYENEYKYNISENTRIDIRLEKPELPKIKINRKTYNSIDLNVSSQLFKSTNFCIDASVNYLFLNSNTHNETEKPKGYSSYDKCYGQFTLKESSEKILITFSPISESQGKMDIIFYDIAGNNQTYPLITN